MYDVFAPCKCVIDFTLDHQHNLNSLYWLWTYLGVWWCPAVSWTEWPSPPLSRSCSSRLYLYADIRQRSLPQLPFDTYLWQWPVAKHEIIASFCCIRICHYYTIKHYKMAVLWSWKSGMHMLVLRTRNHKIKQNTGKDEQNNSNNTRTYLGGEACFRNGKLPLNCLLLLHIVIIIVIESNIKMTACICAIKLVVIVFYIILHVTTSPYNISNPYSGKSECSKNFPDWTEFILCIWG